MARGSAHAKALRAMGLVGRPRNSVAVRQVLTCDRQGKFIGMVIDPNDNSVLAEFVIWNAVGGEAVELVIKYYPDDE